MRIISFGVSFLILCFLSLLEARASVNCVDANIGTETTAISLSDSSDRSVCFRIKGRTVDDFAVFASKTIDNDGGSTIVRGYDYQILDSDGITLFSSFSHDEAEINGFTIDHAEELSVIVTPTLGSIGRDVRFDLIAGLEDSTYTMIYIGSISSEAVALPPGGGGYCDPEQDICFDPQSTPTEFISIPKQSDFFFYTQSTNEAFQISDNANCTDANRPPSQPLVLKDGSGQTLDISQTLRSASAFSKAKGLRSGTPYQRSVWPIHASFYHLYHNFKNSAQYDVKSNESIWNGDEDYGNFLYGAYMQQMGFIFEETLRFSAGYQAMQDLGDVLGVPLGLYNFFTNSGDGDGDPEMIERGFKYAEEVHDSNPDSLEIAQCVDQQTVNQQIENINAGGSSGGGSSGGSSSSGTIIFSQVCYEVCTSGGCNPYQCDVTFEWINN